ncbi:MAG: translocation/assembly module TamB domain-containing protein [Candidatus Adiutrix sp.]|nr:translocation/assembly module TamB domain-containing protein [Candidatus Adiutrix sp.]
MRQPDRSLSGRAQIQAELGGSLARPQPQGSLYLAGGRYADRVLGLLVNEIALEAHAAPEAPLRAVLSAKDQHGGGLALEAQIADLAQPSLTAQGRVSRFNPLHRDDLKVFLSGDLAAEGPLDRLTLSSNLTVDRGELDLKLVMASGGPATLDFGEPAEKANGRPGGLRFDLKVKLPNQFFIRGYGLDSEWQGDLAIGGSARRPSLTGFLAPVRGYFEIFSKQFQFSGGDFRHVKYVVDYAQQVG